MRDGTLAAGPRPAVDADRHPVRSPGRRLRRQDHQHAPPLGRRRARLLRLPAVQRRRLRRRARRDARRRVAHARALPRRFHDAWAGPALRAGVLPRRLLARRPRAPLPPQQRRLERASREGRDPAQRHAPGAGGARADAHPARRGAARLGRGLGPHAAHARVHQPHAPARGAGEVAARRGSSIMLPRHLEIIYEINRRLLDDVRAPLPRRRRARRAHEPRSRKGAERKIRMANLAIVGSHSTNGVAAIHSELLRTTTVTRPRRDVPRALQQQDQRRDAAALAAAGNPALAATITDAIGDGWITDLDAARASSSRSPTTPRFRDAFRSAKRAGQGAVRRLARARRRARRSTPTRSSTAR